VSDNSLSYAGERRAETCSYLLEEGVRLSTTTTGKGDTPQSLKRKKKKSEVAATVMGGKRAQRHHLIESFNEAGIIVSDKKETAAPDQAREQLPGSGRHQCGKLRSSLR